MHDSFMSATLGSRLSATWRAIWTARKYLAKWLRMRVGNGEQISIYRDAWLNEDSNSHILTQPFGPLAPKSIDELIDPITNI